MHRIFKKTVCILAIICLSAGLFACKKSDEPVKSDQVADAQTNIENETKEAETNEIESREDENIANEIEENDVNIIHPIVYRKQLTCSKPATWELGVNCEYDIFTLADEDKNEYPRLTKAMLKFESDFENQARNTFLNMREIMEENYSVTNSDDEYILDVGRLEDSSKCKVVRSDSVAFSIFCNYYNYYGGAHPFYAFTGYNFDSQTGHELLCEDVVSDVDKLNDILFEKLMSEYGYDCDLNEETVKEHLLACKTGESEYEWLLGYEGVTFYFNPYTLTSYAGGMQIVYLSFADYPEIFSEVYQKKPVNYIEPFCSYSDIYTDIDNDGKVEKISATTNNVDSDYNELYVYITIDDEGYTFNYIDSFNGELYLVHYNGKCYIYNFVSGMGYSELIQCYDLSDGTPKRVHRYVSGSRVVVASDYIDRTETNGMGDEAITESYRAEEVFVDPVNFQLTNWLEALSTCDGLVEFHIDEDGLPTKNSDIYDVSRDWWIEEGEFPSYFVFTTKMELNMSMLDANGNVSDDIVIPKGTKLIYIRTDAKTFADFRLEDGSEVRAIIKCDDYPQMISNENLDEALDGILFAG